MTAAGASGATTKQIRGSTLLLAGRVASLALTLVTQVVLVRSLTRADFGVFAYALALAGSTRLLVTLGQGSSLSRFLSIHDENGDGRRVVGTIAVGFLTIAACGALLFVATVLFAGVIADGVLDAPDARTLLLVLIALGPLDAVDAVFVSIFAVFSKPSMIFFRKYVVTPALRLAVVLVLARTGDPLLVAWGYLVSGIVGIGVYAWVAVPLLRARGLLRADVVRHAVLPFREVLSFSVPLLSAEAVHVSMTAGTATFLGLFAGATSVAGYRAVYPAARVNQFVIFSFNALFLPLASRLFARGDRVAMREAYWQTAVWLAVLTFPVFAMTGPMAGPTTVALFGERYEDAAPVLALLSFGFYVNAALGFNALTLQVFGRIRYVLVVNLTCAAVNIALTLALVPDHGAGGAAVANCLTLVLLNGLNQAGLGRAVGAGLLERSYVRCYGVVTAGALALWGFQWAVGPEFPVALAVAAAVSLGVLLLTRDVLSVGTTFPELGRVPLVGRLVGERGAR